MDVFDVRLACEPSRDCDDHSIDILLSALETMRIYKPSSYTDTFYMFIVLQNNPFSMGIKVQSGYVPGCCLVVPRTVDLMMSWNGFVLTRFVNRLSSRESEGLRVSTSV